MMRPFQHGDIEVLIDRIRKSELVEAEALGEDPLNCLKLAVSQSKTMTLVLNGKVCGIAGVSHQQDVNVPWSVFTDDIEKMPMQFLRACKQWKKENPGPMLNVVLDENEQTKKWLTWLGFNLGPPFEYGPHRKLFRAYWSQ